MVAFWLVGMKSIPVAYVSIKGQQGVAEGSENNNVTAQKIFFARSNKAPKGWSYDHVGFITQDGKQIQMSGHKGNDVYVTNDVTDDPEFPKQNIKIVSLSKPVSVPTTNSIGAENCGTFVANVLQANGVKGIDTQKIYSVFKKPQEQGVTEGLEQEFEFELDTEKGRLNVYNQYGGPAGRIEFYPTNSKTINIDLIIVQPQYQRKGLGTQMFNYLKDRGYTIKRPTELTPDGKKFFGKLKQRGVAEGTLR